MKKNKKQLFNRKTPIFTLYSEKLPANLLSAPQKKLRTFLAVALFLASSCSTIREDASILEQPPIKVENRSFFASVPIIKLSPIEIPCVNVEIEGKQLLMELDLGFRGDLAITQDAADSILSKTFVGEKPMFGIRGKKYIQQLYRIPKAKIGKMVFSPPIFLLENQDFLKDATFLQGNQTPSPRETGRIGWELFCDTSLLIDVPNLQIAFSDGIETLKNRGYPTENFIKAPLFLERGLVEVEIGTPNGPVRSVLDTGATWNILHEEFEEGLSVDAAIWEPENIVEYTSFSIENNDLGPITFHKMPLKIPIPIEAILGMEFFTKYIVFLDFKGKAAYFLPCQAANTTDLLKNRAPY